MLDPAPTPFLIRAGNEGRIGIPVPRGRRPHRLRVRTNHGELAVTLQLLTAARVDESPVVPGLGDDRREASHAASASLAPTAAMALGPASILTPTSRTSSKVTASSRATISQGSTNARSRIKRVAR